MNPGLQFSVVDPDDDYLGIEIHGWNERFSGTTFVYAGLDELSEFAARIAGFPANSQDMRTYEFGSLDGQIAGDYCSLRFFTLDSAGNAALEIILKDDEGRFGPETAKFRLHHVDAASINQFLQNLRLVEREQIGEATLVATL